jgi:predicted amino acid dehydrogenase
MVDWSMGEDEATSREEEPVPQVLVIESRGGERDERAVLLGREMTLLRRGCGGDVERAAQLIRQHDGCVATIALEGLPMTLELGGLRRPHAQAARLPACARRSLVVDGHGIRSAFQRWGLMLAARAEPGLFAHRRVLMMPGLNHDGVAQGLLRVTGRLRYADPALFFGLPRVPGVGSRRSLQQAAPATLRGLADAPFEMFTPDADSPPSPRVAGLCRRADLLAGDAKLIRRHAPPALAHKTVVVDTATEDDIDDFRRRGVSILVTLMPALEGPGLPARHGAATIEAMLAAARPDPDLPLAEDTYLELMGQIEWMPSILYLQPGERDLRRFAFVIHPLSVGFIHRDPLFRWTRWLPDRLVEWVAARLPPLYLARITGAVSPASGQRVEGHLYSLGATPRQMMAMGERATYRRLNLIARMAERRGARIMGLGAFTSVVGDAGVTVARQAGIAVTSGNSLTVAATLEAAKQAVRMMGVEDLRRGTAMVIGATGSIGAVCARLLAQAIGDVVLVSIEPERLIELKRRIVAETPGARVVVATRSWELLPRCDLVVTTTSAFGQRVLDISRCKPGAVICDVARPPDVQAAEAALRPDVLVIESGEVIIPGEIDFGYDIGLPRGTAYACLAETALLAMEGRFENFTIGRELEMEKVKEIFRLFRKHGFRIAGLRSFGQLVTEEDVAARREEAVRLADDPTLLEDAHRRAAAALAEMPTTAKGVGGRRRRRRRSWPGALLGLLLRRPATSRRPARPP